MRGKTIQVFLTDGSPRGIKLAEQVVNKICQFLILK